MVVMLGKKRCANNNHNITIGQINCENQNGQNLNVFHFGFGVPLLDYQSKKSTM